MSEIDDTIRSLIRDDAQESAWWHATILGSTPRTLTYADLKAAFDALSNAPQRVNVPMISGTEWQRIANDPTITTERERWLAVLSSPSLIMELVPESDATRALEASYIRAMSDREQP